VAAVLELDVHPHPELLDVERRRRPVDPDLLADAPSLFGGELLLLAHAGTSIKP